jgi:hypothetical protein
MNTNRANRLPDEFPRESLVESGDQQARSYDLVSIDVY